MESQEHNREASGSFERRRWWNFPTTTLDCLPGSNLAFNDVIWLTWLAV